MVYGSHCLSDVTILYLLFTLPVLERNMCDQTISCRSVNTHSPASFFRLDECWSDFFTHFDLQTEAKLCVD